MQILRIFSRFLLNGPRFSSSNIPSVLQGEARDRSPVRVGAGVRALRSDERAAQGGSAARARIPGADGACAQRRVYEECYSKGEEAESTRDKRHSLKKKQPNSIWR